MSNRLGTGTTKQKHAPIQRDAYSKKGRPNKGVARELRLIKHEEANARNALTPPERRRQYRRNAAAQLALEIFSDQQR